MTDSRYTQEERQKHGITGGLIRFSIGLQTLSDLTHDIFQALAAIHFQERASCFRRTRAE